MIDCGYRGGQENRDDFQVKSEDGMVGRCGFGDGLLVVRWSFADSLLPMRHKSEGTAKEERRMNEGRATDESPAAKLRGTVAGCA